MAVARVASPAGGKAWRAGALMIERLPKAEGGDSVREAEDDGWRRAMALMSTSTAAELLDPGLPPEKLLFRLFHEEGVRAYKPHDLAAVSYTHLDVYKRQVEAIAEKHGS